MAASDSSRGTALENLKFPLAGLSVVECGQGVAAAYAGKLLALLGADVVKVEPPGGDLTRKRGPFFNDAVDVNQSGLFLYLNADKKGVTLDLTDAGDRAASIACWGAPISWCTTSRRAIAPHHVWTAARSHGTIPG